MQAGTRPRNRSTREDGASRMGNARGFSLFESVMALVIFSLGVLSVTQAFNAGLFASAASESLDTAVSVAEGRMEELKNTAFAALVSTAATADPVFPIYNVTVGVTGTEPKTVDVTVSWANRGGNSSIRLTTLRANY